MTSRIALGSLLVSLVLAPSLEGQQWNARQQEAWAFEQSCYQKAATGDADAYATCFHPSYVGWNAPDPVPMALDRGLLRYFLASAPVKAYNMTPHHILIHGDVAIMHLSALTVTTGPDGKDVQRWWHWTDIALNENGRWSWIADHGHSSTSGSE